MHCCPGLSHTLTFVYAVSCKLRHDELPAARCMPCGAVAWELLSPLWLHLLPQSLNLLPSVHEQTITLPPSIMFLTLKLSILEPEAHGPTLFNFLSLSLPISLVQPSPHWQPVMSRGSLDQCPLLLLIKSLSFPLNASTKLLAIKCLLHHNRDINTRVSSSEKPVRVLGEFSMADDPFSEPCSTSGFS